MGQNKKDPLAMLKSIQRICKTYDYWTAINIVKEAAKRTGIPLDSIKNKTNETILHYVSSPTGDLNSLKVIIAAADDCAITLMLARDNYGSTALHRAALHYDSAFAQTVISAAQNLGILQKLISIKDHDKETALDIAIHWCGRREIIVTLQEAWILH
jgi:ankyrin repeat protein